MFFALTFFIICRRANIWSIVERPGMKPACCIRFRDLIADTDLRSRMSARSFPGIDRRVIPRWFAQVRRSPLRFQNGRMMHPRQSSGIFSLIQTQFIITCSHRSMHSPPNLKVRPLSCIFLPLCHFSVTIRRFALCRV